MTTLNRVAITYVAALLNGAFSYLSAFDIDRTGILGSLLNSDVFGWAFLALTVLTVVLVNRWWALSIVLVPLSVEFLLHSGSDYNYPYHEDPYPALSVFWTLCLLGVSSLGLLLRAVVDLAVDSLSRHRDKSN
jgi:hypothetical protein